jgi:hypothetical protein
LRVVSDAACIREIVSLNSKNDRLYSTANDNIYWKQEETC